MDEIISNGSLVLPIKCIHIMTHTLIGRWLPLGNWTLNEAHTSSLNSRTWEAVPQNPVLQPSTTPQLASRRSPYKEALHCQKLHNSMGLRRREASPRHGRKDQVGSWTDHLDPSLQKPSRKLQKENRDRESKEPIRKMYLGNNAELNGEGAEVVKAATIAA